MREQPILQVHKLSKQYGKGCSHCHGENVQLEKTFVQLVKQFMHVAIFPLSCIVAKYLALLGKVVAVSRL